jgi:Kef-type K+ transport system membrane component KefB
VGAVAGNLIGLQITDWVNFLAGFGAILLTFLAGTEIDPRTIRKHFWSSMTIGDHRVLNPHSVLFPQSGIAGGRQGGGGLYWTNRSLSRHSR